MSVRSFGFEDLDDCDAAPDIGVREVPGTADCDLYRCMLSASIAIRRFSSRLRP